jgi:hypothetical protein
MTQTSITNALILLADAGARLRTEWHLPWPADVEQAVYRARLDATEAIHPPIAALLGGASSGKSTIFDNLLGGQTTSRITARGHATVGPILAVHESDRPLADRLLADDRLFPGLPPQAIELDADSTGELGRLSVAYHKVEALRGVLLLDLPDFTSDAAAREGDLALVLLPWFDRIAIILDYERWFDRQATSLLSARSLRWGQQRWVIFNQTHDAELNQADRAKLTDQAAKLSADGVTILDFLRGRGLCLFPRNAFDDLLSFLRTTPPDRRPALARCIAEAAKEVLTENETRSARIKAMSESLRAVLRRTTPDRRACMLAVMTRAERSQLDIVSRVLKPGERRRWFLEQTRRLTGAIRQIPLIGSLAGVRSGEVEQEIEETTDRRKLGIAFAQRVIRRHAREVERIVMAGPFWNDLRRRAGVEPPAAATDTVEGINIETDIGDAVSRLDDAVRKWNERVETECEGLSPHVRGAIGAGTIGLAIVLIAVPGPFGALTIAAAKTALAASLVELLAATGAGAVVGRHLTRLRSVIQEKLIGSAEYNAVCDAADELRARIAQAAERVSDRALNDAERFVLQPGDPVRNALEQLREAKR